MVGTVGQCCSQGLGGLDWWFTSCACGELFGGCDAEVVDAEDFGVGTGFGRDGDGVAGHGGGGVAGSAWEEKVMFWERICRRLGGVGRERV